MKPQLGSLSLLRVPAAAVFVAAPVPSLMWPVVPVPQEVCPFLGSTLPQACNCLAHQHNTTPFGLAVPPKENRNV